MNANIFFSFVTAFFVGISANSAVVTDDDHTENTEKILKTETFNVSYKNTSYSGTFERLECTANIYDNKKVEIRVVHNPQRDNGHSSIEFGKITYPEDTYYTKIDLSNSVLHAPNTLSKKEINEKGITGFDYKYYADIYGFNTSGEIFTVTLIPTIYLDSPVTVNVFGHEIFIPSEYDPYNDSIYRLDVDRNGLVDAVDASWILKIYSENSTGNDIKTIGELFDNE